MSPKVSRLFQEEVEPMLELLRRMESVHCATERHRGHSKTLAKRQENIAGLQLQLDGITNTNAKRYQKVERQMEKQRNLEGREMNAVNKAALALARAKKKLDQAKNGRAKMKLTRLFDPLPSSVSGEKKGQGSDVLK